ncbi:MAG: 3-deoxy-D-manno-octulosonic acid transferase [Bacteroidetes bacterium]|nr:MAG: 3-deoxy-D-manno-octulosonic acid transferase [Bacteroidota bacterium]
MTIFYSIGYAAYKWAVQLASIVNPKAKKWVEGRSHIFSDLEGISTSDKIIWIHAASMGEYEMARPVMERLKVEAPDHKILVSFFSPSGYESRKADPAHDYACYLPHDYRRNAAEFIQHVQPVMAVFVKYEFWPNILTACFENDIPVNLISATFRKDHFIFSAFGKPIQKLLKKFTVISVQDETSESLLLEKGFANVTRTGDGRFDNVLKLAETEYNRPELEAFIDYRQSLIAGSCWREDEDVVLPQIMAHTSLAVILVPHDVSESNIVRLMKRLPAPAYRWSQRSQIENPGEYRVLVVDTIGELRAMYSHASIAFVGGGYKTGLHNILEPASYSVPVFFGPVHHKFWEAQEMINAGGAQEIENPKTFTKALNTLVMYPQKATEMGARARNFVEKHAGAGRAITELLLPQLRS